MRSSIFKAMAVTAALAYMPITTAQEGHPMKGSWIGVWASNQVHDENVLMVLDWDGNNITGIINPGTDNIQVSNANLNPDDWSITIEGGGYVISGKIERLELPNRAVVGTWQRDNASGHFEIVRQ